MSASSFAALRSMIEQYLKNTRYVCTCNYLHKIPEPIQSRFTCIEFERLNFDETKGFVSLVAQEEGIWLPEPIIEEIVKKSNGDLRTALNLLQRVGITKESIHDISPLAEQVFGLINAGSWSKLRKEIPLLNPDYTALLVELEQMIYDSDLGIDKKAIATEIIAQTLFEMASSFDMDIAFAACCSKLIKGIRG